MPNDRTAIDTITGYYYQFDYYILQLLNCSGNDEVCIEAIEDVDIRIADETTAVQCKYYAKTEYNHSVIAKPIRLMLNHFKQNTTNRDNIHYKLYGHFESGQSKLDQPISLIFLKEKFLTYTRNNVKHEHHKDLNLSDSELLQFLNHLTININAVEFSAQKRTITTKLKELFRCSEFEAEYCDLSRYRASKQSIEQIAKEGRKYGVTLLLSSQRPSEISETIFAQCNNFLALRLTNPNDQNYVKRLLPDTSGSLVEKMPSLKAGECILVGDAVTIPSIVHIEECDPKPSSNDIPYLDLWKTEWKELDISAIKDEWLKI